MPFTRELSMSRKRRAPLQKEGPIAIQGEGRCQVEVKFCQEPFPGLPAGGSSLGSGAAWLVSAPTWTRLFSVFLCCIIRRTLRSARTFGRGCHVTQSSQTHMVPGALS